MALLPVFAAPAEAHSDTDPQPCKKTHTLVSFKQTARHAFAQHRWRDPTPVKDWERERMLRAKMCPAPVTSRIEMERFERKAREQFLDYRHERKAAIRARRSETPYDCGSPGRFAIPCYVVACESGYSWSAYNASSGAFGPYQLLPSTYSGVCEACDRSKGDQHEAAGDVWARSGGSEWVCA